MKLLTLVFILFLGLSAFGQDKASLNSWRGLTLDETTVNAALEKFPAPKEDKSNQSFRPIKYDEWFNVKKNKNFRLLQYSNIEGFKNVILVFLTV